MNSKVFTIAEIEWEDNPALAGGSTGQLGDWFMEVLPMGEVSLLTMRLWSTINSEEEHILPHTARAKDKAQEVIAEWLAPYLVEGGSE